MFFAPICGASNSSEIEAAKHRLLATPFFHDIALIIKSLCTVCLLRGVLGECWEHVEAVVYRRGGILECA